MSPLDPKQIKTFQDKMDYTLTFLLCSKINETHLTSYTKICKYASAFYLYITLLYILLFSYGSFVELIVS